MAAMSGSRSGSTAGVILTAPAGATPGKMSEPASPAPPPPPGNADEQTPPGPPGKDDMGWRRIVRNFTPSWFSVNMGTGIVAVLLHNLPYSAEWVRCLSIGIFVLNAAMFGAFGLITAMRFILYPEIWSVMIRHPTQSLFLSCFPMAFSTIVNMFVYVCASWGHGAVYFAWAMWWLDAAVSFACSLAIPFIVVRHHHNQLQNVTAALLLPVVPVIVASATGGVVAEVLPNPGHALTTVVVSYIMWGLGQAFSFYIMAIYFLRLQLHDLPARDVIVSVFLPVGPLSQGGFAIQQLGKVARKVLPLVGAADGGRIGADVAAQGGLVLYVVGVLAALVLWGAAVGWLAFALFSIATTKSFPFNMGWWGFTFPLGVFASCMSLLATELDSGFFRVLTMFFSASVTMLWLVVASKTTIQAIKGDIFFAPCLRDLRRKTAQSGGDRTA